MAGLRTPQSLIWIRRPRKKAGQSNARLESQGSGGYDTGQVPDSHSSACGTPPSATQDLDSRLIANAVNSPEDPQRIGEIAPLFVGDGQGVGAILDAMLPNSKTQHLMIPRAAAKALQPEDLQYLRLKGCFSLPDMDVCQSLLLSYFRYVHPLFPILDAQDFCMKYNAGGVHQINLLLLWSIFSVSASYIEDDHLHNAGFKTRKDMKEAIVKRAKLMFDLTCENDKIVLIQSALLLSFWFKDAEDVMQSWHWTGVAIGISQTLGLHRDPDAVRKNIQITDQQRRLWRNIWWSCMHRDSSLACGMGRPMRINIADCDCPIPIAADSEMDLQGLLVKSAVVYEPSDIKELACQWINLFDLSQVLREIISFRYRPRQVSPSTTEVDALLQRLHRCSPMTITRKNQSLLLKITVNQLDMHLQFSKIVLLRPDRHESAKSEVQGAANAVNAVLEDLMSNGSINFASPQMMTTIVPAMQVHLMAIKSKAQVTSKLATNKLELCLLFLAELEDNYPAAAIIRRLFSTAKDNRERSSRKVSTERTKASVSQLEPKSLLGSSMDITSSLRSDITDTEMYDFLFPMAETIWNMPASQADHFSMNLELDSLPLLADDLDRFFDIPPSTDPP